MSTRSGESPRMRVESINTSFEQPPLTDDAARLLQSIRVDEYGDLDGGRSPSKQTDLEPPASSEALDAGGDVDVNQTVAAAAYFQDVRPLFEIRSALIGIAAKRSRLPRLLITILLPIQMAVLVVSAAVAGRHRETIPENVRTVCILLALLCTVLVASRLAPVANLKAQTRWKAMLKVLSLIFEFQHFAIAGDWSTLFVLGAIVIGITFVILILCAVAHYRMGAIDPDDTELSYTVFAAGTNDLKELAEQTKAAILEQQALIGGRNADFEGMTSRGRAFIARAEADARENHSEDLNQFVLDQISSVVANVRLKRGGIDPTDFRNWNAANRIRREIFSADTVGNSTTVTMLLLFFAFALGNITYEFAKIFANQPPLFSDSLNDDYNDKGRTQSYFGPNRSHATWRVHMVVVDGLRDDMTLPGASAIGDLFAEPAVAANSIKMKMKAQLPSFSVPNWITLLSGAPPEQTGVTGNLLASETSYDHIFGQCANYNIHAGLTGTPWWRDLIFSTVPKLDGDGTIWSTYEPPGTPTYDWTTSNPADEERLRVALTAGTRSRLVSPYGPSGSPQLYELFLTHFSDVDTQGHEYGVDSEWNTRNTYYGAIANKTQAIRDIMAQMDSRTVLIVTSDHGHVRRGGHGGVSGVLRQVPIVFYTRSVPLTAATPVAFPADQGPRHGAYENTDFAATVAALLGVPAPRQTTGIFMEEAVRTLVPGAVLPRHYYDLFRARYSLVQQLVEHIGSDFWGNLSADSEIASAQVTRLYNSNGTASAVEYGDGIRLLDTQYGRLRRNLMLFDLVRNLIVSLIMLVPVFGILYIAVSRYGVANFGSIVRSSSVVHRQNLAACIKALITVVLHIGLSLAVFLIGYFGVTGYSVWDSTLTHTTSVAVTFLSRTIVAPVFIFVILTRIFMFTSIRWRTKSTLLEIRAIRAGHGRKMTHRVIIEWIHNFFLDVGSFCFGTARYRKAGFSSAYLYQRYLAVWSTISAVVLSFMCFPFTFIVPVVFSTPYVTDFNAEWRFRIITMLMLILPLLAGTALLLAIRPKLDSTTVVMWDVCLLELDVANAIELLQAELDALREAEKNDPAGDRLAAIQTLQGRLALAERSAKLLMDPLCAFTEDGLCMSEILRHDKELRDYGLMGNTTKPAPAAGSVKED